MAHVLGIRTVAEGVSSEPLFERVRQLEVDYAQGYWIGRPGPLEAMDDDSI
jgi:EAL domain-containing protein (putative c-di-GMP-specific phosphodiesterase class I)